LKAVHAIQRSLIVDSSLEQKWVRTMLQEEVGENEMALGGEQRKERIISSTRRE
jgi:hypothetical protein